MDRIGLEQRTDITSVLLAQPKMTNCYLALSKGNKICLRSEATARHKMLKETETKS